MGWGQSIIVEGLCWSVRKPRPLMLSLALTKGKNYVDPLASRLERIL